MAADRIADADLDIAWVPVESSNVHAARWVAADEYGGRDDVMEVEFHGGRSELSRYRYFGVGYGTWLQFLAADSKGKWVWRVLRRGKFKYERVF